MVRLSPWAVKVLKLGAGGSLVGETVLLHAATAAEIKTGAKMVGFIARSP
jgi:hypothetical protein